MKKILVNNISVKVKIYSIAAMLSAALILSTGYALYSMNKIGEELFTIAEEDIPLTNIVTEITIHQLEQAINLERALRYGEELKREPTARQHYEEAIKSFATLSSKIGVVIKKGEDIAQEAMQLAHTDTDFKEFKHVDDILKQVEKEHHEYTQHADKVFTLVNQHKMHEAYVASLALEKEEENINHNLKNLLFELENFTHQSALAAEHHEQDALYNLTAISFIAIILSLAASFFIIRAITTSLKKAIDSAAQISSGVLTHEVPMTGKDEIGQLLCALAEMRNKLHSMITEMNHASTELAATSEEMATVTKDCNHGTHQQQSEVEQAATAMNEMAATIHEVAQNAQQTAEAAHSADAEAHKGQTVVTETVDSIQTLAEAIDNAADVIQKVGQDSENIGTVLDVIKGIAEQTNLLALNAAIEAARAGEQGRGFAVVADEVRSLAQRTQESTSEIEDMINNLQDSSSNAVSAMQHGREQVQGSVEKAGNAGFTLSSITGIVAQINDMNTHIASAAEEQSSVAEELNRNFTRISQISDTNASAVHQISASSEELSRMAAGLQDMIAQFEI